MSNLLRKTSLFVRRNASTVLTIAGGIGVVSTAVLAVKATPKALRKLEEAKVEKNEELTTIEKFKIAGPTYIPTVIMGTATLACIFGANALNKRQQAALISAYAMVDTSFKEYKQKVKELYGEETHNEIVNSIMVEKAKDMRIHSECLCNSCELTDDEACGEPVLFYDEYSSRYFETTIEQVIAGEYHLNRNFVLRGYTTLNELYDFLGLETTDYGNTVGWSVEDEFYWIDFNHKKVVLDDGLECYILETPWGPSAEALEYYYY